jgi:hypothetical protein
MQGTAPRRHFNVTVANKYKQTLLSVVNDLPSEQLIDIHWNSVRSGQTT